MESYTTVDGSPEDAAAFTAWLVRRDPQLARSPATLLIDLHAADFYTWRLTRFMHEGIPAITILDTIKAPRSLMMRVVQEGASFLADLMDDTMIPEITAVIDAQLLRLGALTQPVGQGL